MSTEKVPVTSTEQFLDKTGSGDAPPVADRFEQAAKESQNRERRRRSKSADASGGDGIASPEGEAQTAQAVEAEVVGIESGRARRRRAKQETFEEMKQEEIPAVTEAAEKYVALRNERMELTRSEVDAREFLIDLMHKNNLTTYKVGNMTATLEAKEKVKVKVEEEDEELEVY